VTGGGGAPVHNPFGGVPNPYRVPVKAETVRHYSSVRVASGGSQLTLEALREDGGEIDAFTLE
jgi:hypothetical protein